MTIHDIQGYVAPDSGMTDTEVEAAIDDWVSKRSKWSGGSWDATVERANTALDGSGTDYLRFSVRFEWSADKANTLQKAADKLKNKVGWFALVYHVCDHDAATTGGCGWDERWNWDDGTGIPSAVEEQVPDAATVVNA